MNEARIQPSADDQSRVANRPSRARFWPGIAIAIVIFGSASVFHLYRSGAAAQAPVAALPQVVVSEPLVRNLNSTLGFLGQFSAVDQVELRAQVGGTLTQIHFKDGEIVHKGDLLFSIDARPYEIKLAEATAQLETATSHLALAEREFDRAQELKREEAGTVENVDQRTADRQAAQASVDDARARIRDAEFDIEHCRITAPFTGRIGTHLVSVGNLVAGSRAATSPTTLLATLVSLDPIHLDFDMSESEFLQYSHYRSQNTESPPDTVEIARSDETNFTRHGILDFVDNVLDHSSGTIHARATVPNPGFVLTPGEFARVRLVVAAPAPTLLVPDAAVLPDQSQHLVMTVASDGTVVPKQVQVSDLRGGLRVIRSGLAANNRVVIDGIAFATPGAKVTTQGGTIRYAAAAGQD